MIWQTLHRRFDLGHQALVMGVLNLTRDSFSDGGRFSRPADAVGHALEMAAAGAEIIDVGGESTRPGAQPVEEPEELDRVLPVIAQLAGDPRFVLSIDTMKPAVALAALQHGAAIVNDVTGLQNPAMREVVQATGAGAIAMHMRGTPRDMQLNPRYDDVTAEIGNYFRQTFQACVRSGIDPQCLAFDPGIGFGKTPAHNLALLKNLESMRVNQRPLVLGVSRKSFLAGLTGSPAMEDREWPTVALSAYGRHRGANVLRVHSVRANVEALRMTEALLTP